MSGLHNLAWGPAREVKSWPVYFVNGYKFHIETWSIGKKIVNSGVCVVGSTDGENERDYYGVLKDIIQLQYTGGNKVTLFECN